MNDKLARILSLLALSVALASSFGSASADPTTEPDSAALSRTVAQMQLQINQLSADDQDANARLIDLEDDSNFSNCLIYSDKHFIREQFTKNGHPYGKKWRMPLVVWNMANKACR